jgi:hypothetical protein
METLTTYRNEAGRWVYMGRMYDRLAMGMGATIEEARADYLAECEEIEEQFGVSP